MYKDQNTRENDTLHVSTLHHCCLQFSFLMPVLLLVLDKSIFLLGMYNTFPVGKDLARQVIIL